MKNWEELIDAKNPAFFDLETITLSRETVEDARVSLGPGQRPTMSRSLLAERIIKSTAQGERDCERLLDAALMYLAA